MKVAGQEQHWMATTETKRFINRTIPTFVGSGRQLSYCGNGRDDQGLMAHQDVALSHLNHKEKVTHMDEVNQEKILEIEPPSMWRCGDAYHYPIPKPNDDPWEVVFEASMKRDKARCDAWKDEVQNLLIFAGLFSAVVTAFVVESAKSLQPDSGELSVLLLSRIVASLETISNGTGQSPSNGFESSPLVVPGSPSSIVRTNIFWFMSLVLSLTTVLVGIVSLQWLREHQSYDSSFSPQQAVGIFNMRAEALEEWHVPAIFASLPLLLQAALILFFVGILDFLQSLSHLVMIPVAALLLCPVLFIIATTTIPTLQSFTASVRLPSSDSSVPTPCPYKSPQSYAFRRFATSSRSFYTFAHHHMVQLLYIFYGIAPSLRPSDKTRNNDAWRYRLFPNRAFLFWAHRNWLDFDRTWLILRNEHFDIVRKRRTDEPAYQPTVAEPVYDVVRSIAGTAKGNEYSDPAVFSVYHCFQDLVQLTLSEDIYTHHHLQACYRDLIPTWNAPISNIVSIVVNPSLELLHDIHTAQFLRLPGILKKATNPTHIFGRHMLELYTRIIVFLYADQPRKISEGSADSPTGFFHWYTINMAEASEDFLEQFFALFQSFINFATTVTDETSLLHTFHAHSDLDEFISLASFLTWHAVTTSNDASHTLLDETKEPHRCLSILLSTLDTIEKTLTKHLRSRATDQISAVMAHTTEGPDFLFICTALYIRRLWQTRPSPSRIDSLPDVSLFSQLLLRLQALQHNTLLPYDQSLDRAKLPDLYRRILHPDFLPAAYLKRGAGDFVPYGKTCGLSLAKGTDGRFPRYGIGQPMRRRAWEHGVEERRRFRENYRDVDNITLKIPVSRDTPTVEGSNQTRHYRSDRDSSQAVVSTSPSPATQLHYNPNAPDAV